MKKLCLYWRLLFGGHTQISYGKRFLFHNLEDRATGTCSTYIVLDTMDRLERIRVEAVPRLDANTTPFPIRGMSIWRSWHPRNQFPGYQGMPAFDVYGWYSRWIEKE